MFGPAGPPPNQPLTSIVQQVPSGVPQDLQPEYALQRSAEEQRALAMRLGEVATAAVFTSQPR